MKNSKVYILSIYNEDGAENVHATSDKNLVKDLLHKLAKEVGMQVTPRELVGLGRLLKRDELTIVCGTNLDAIGWGGFQLHIVKLEDATH